MNEVNEASPASETRDVERVVMLPHLVNRGDGVDGHYCICRMHPKGYREAWDVNQQKWGSAGTVFNLGKAT
jgi:hypothetical protein